MGNTFKMRPHCGESGATHHLATMFLLADGINHGINLSKEPSIQYLYYLTQIGISVSPLSNNALFKKIEDNPFYNFLERGLNVTLSTDDPLQFHMCNTSNALMEEYVVAKSRWSLTNTDLAEITRNSVLQSGFSHKKKQEYIGNQYRIGGVVGNEEGKTGIPKCRSAFRQEALLIELHDIYNATVRPFDGNKDIIDKAVEVQVETDGKLKWVEAKISRLPQSSVRVPTKFWEDGIEVILDNEKTLTIQDESNIRFRDRRVPLANTVWRWESGDPVTWEDLAAKGSAKDKTTTVSTNDTVERAKRLHQEAHAAKARWTAEQIIMLRRLGRFRDVNTSLGIRRNRQGQKRMHHHSRVSGGNRPDL